MQQKGSFIVIDGPNGVGKTTVASEVARRLRDRGLDVLLTSEPTNSPLGESVRDWERSYRGRTYACLIAADRYYHLENEVLPATEQGQVVISARYVISSLVLQRLDGVSMDFVWALNSEALRPDLTVVLTAPPETLANRLSARGSLSWFEQQVTRVAELEAYPQAAVFLEKQGQRVLVLDNGNTPLDAVVDRIIMAIDGS
ncbi:MAG TPA: dTMP kinase [Symbiobacteriaceae bacterium]|jgi:dTMP kinase